MEFMLTCAFLMTHHIPVGTSAGFRPIISLSLAKDLLAPDAEYELRITANHRNGITAAATVTVATARFRTVRPSALASLCVTKT